MEEPPTPPPPRIKLEHLQRPKDMGRLALPNPWLYYLATQIQHFIGVMNRGVERGSTNCSSSQSLMLHTVKVESVPVALEALAFGKLHKIYPTYNLSQKIWNKTKYLQGVTGYTEFSLIWSIETYPEIAKLQYGALWKRYGVI